MFSFTLTTRVSMMMFIAMFILISSLLITTTTASDNFKLKVMPTPVGQPRTYIEFLFSRLEPSQAKSDKFVLTMQGPTRTDDEKDTSPNPFDYIEPQFFHFHVTLNGESLPVVDVPPSYVFHHDEQNTKYYTDPIEFIFNKQITENDTLRFIGIIDYNSLLPTLNTLPNQGGLTLEVEYTAAVDDGAEPIVESDKQDMRIVPSPIIPNPIESHSSSNHHHSVTPANPNAIKFDYFDFPESTDYPAPSYFSIKIPNNQLEIGDVRIRPFGFWEYRAEDQPLYCFLDGIFVGQGSAPDTLNEQYFFFDIPLEYPAEFVLPKNQDAIIDCYYSGTIVDQANYEKNQPIWGLSVSVASTNEALGTNSTTIIFILPNTKGKELAGDHIDFSEAPSTVPIDFKFNRIASPSYFKFTPQWWRSQMSLNVPKKANSNDLTSTFSYLYHLTPEDGMPHQWDEKKLQSFHLTSERFPSDYQLTHASYSIGCYSDAGDGEKSMTVMAYGKLEGNTTKETKLHFNDDKNSTSVNFRTDPISPYTNFTDTNGKPGWCNTRSDGMMYVSLQIQHKKEFQLDPTSKFPTPYPFIWLHVTEGLQDLTSKETILTPYTRQQGNMIDNLPRVLVSDTTQFTMHVDPVFEVNNNNLNNTITDLHSYAQFIEKINDNVNGREVLGLNNEYLEGEFVTLNEDNEIILQDQLSLPSNDKKTTEIKTGLYLITNVTLANITTSAYYMSLYLPDGQYSFGSNVTSSDGGLDCWMNGNKTDKVLINGWMNATLEVVLNYDFVAKATYTMSCSTATPFWLVPTSARMQAIAAMNEKDAKKEDAHKKLLVVAHTLPNDFINGSFSTANIVHFTDQSDELALWKKILLIVLIGVVGVMAIAAVSVLLYCCCCGSAQNYKKHQSGDDFTIDDGASANAVHAYGSIS